MVFSSHSHSDVVQSLLGKNTHSYLFNLFNLYWILSSYILPLGIFLDKALLPSSPTKTKDFGYEIFKVTTGEEASIVLAQLAICGKPQELLGDNTLPFTLRSPVWVKQRLTVSKGCYRLVMAWELIRNKLLYLVCTCLRSPGSSYFRDQIQIFAAVVTRNGSLWAKIKC